MTATLCNRRVVLNSRPKGIPEAHHFTIEDVAVPELGDGEILILSEYWSVDPAMRGWVNDGPSYVPPVAIGEVMRSFSVGNVVASNNKDFEVGAMVTGLFGWQTYVVSDGTNVDRTVTETDLSPSLALGVLGLTGITAYFGLLDSCEPKAGETVVVSTAAGSVGSAVGQIAKIKGCHTVGITGSAEKVALCRERYGYDAVINYRNEDVSTALKVACPDGIDCYFDNTCGPISDAVMKHLATNARITICGTVAVPNWEPIPEGPRLHRQVLVARARMQGFLVLDYKPRFAEAIQQLAAWVRDGQLAIDEHVLSGAEAAPGAIKMLYESRNTGKLLIRV